MGRKKRRVVSRYQEAIAGKQSDIFTDKEENDILEALVDQAPDELMPPKRQFTLKLKFKVERNKGPYNV